MRTRNASIAQGMERPKRDPVRFFRETFAELRKVTWPTRQEAVRLTVMVIIVSAVVGMLLGAIDYLFTILVTRVLIGL